MDERQTDKVSVQLVNIVEHLAAKEPDFFQESLERKTELKGEWILDLHWSGGQKHGSK